MEQQANYMDAKILIVAAKLSVAQYYARMKGLRSKEWKFVGDYHDLYGIDWNSPVIVVESDIPLHIGLLTVLQHFPNKGYYFSDDAPKVSFFTQTEEQAREYLDKIADWKILEKFRKK